MISANLDPVWNEEVELTLSGDTATYRTECTLWDHDKFTKKDYMGEFNVNLKHHFAGHAVEKGGARPRWYSLTSFRSGRRSSVVSGSVELKFWLEDRSNPTAAEADLRSSWGEFVGLIEAYDGAKIALAAPDRPVGMQMAEEEEYNGDEDLEHVRSGDLEDESDLDTVLGDDSDLDLSEADLLAKADGMTADPDSKLSRKQRKQLRKQQKRKPFHFKTANSKDVIGVVFLEIDSAKDLPRERNVTKTGFDMDPFVITSFSKKTFRTRVVRHALNPVFNDKLVLQVRRHEDQYSLKFSVVDRDKLSGNDFVGDCDLQIQELIRFGPQADQETGLYCLSNVEATPTSAPINRKRLLGMRKLTRNNSRSNFQEPSQSSCQVQADIDKLSPALAKLETSSSAGSPEMLDSMRQFDLPINLARKDFWGDKHNPSLQFKAKFVPYPALRQQFWRVILRHYDVDETGTISRVELTTMLDSLGATLKDSTINTFFQRFSTSRNSSRPHSQVDIDCNATTCLDESLTIDQCVICLEDQLSKGNKKPGTSTIARTASSSSLQLGATPTSALIRPQSGRTISSLHLKSLQTPNGSRPPSRMSTKHTASEPSVSPGLFDTVAQRSPTSESSSASAVVNTPLDDYIASEEDHENEYLISLTTCPLCRKSNMDKKSATDIVTHLATCASQDWRKVDHLVMGDFVTPSQAQRKWYTKIISKVGYGGYKLGANTANILVQDRRTGHVQEERMSVYVRLGIRLLYKGMKSSRMETSRIKKMLRSMSVKQGRKYDSPTSAKDIRSFIAFHQLNMSEVLDPVDSFKSFNEFFYRKLKPGARPCSQPDDPRYLVSPADCRSVVFNSITSATEIWIKGQNFSLQRLFGDAYPAEVDRFQGGSIGVFRLAPQDYHRFHIPVDGTLGTPKPIEGQYYTVNPMAIRSNLDVYGENVRVLVPVESPIFGKVMIVCVGAMMVGSTVITALPNTKVSRTDELGYFKFGGSTILLIFEPGKMVFDEDLVENSKSSVETLVRVGSSIGHPPGLPDAPNESTERVTEEDKAAASRAIAGHQGGLMDGDASGDVEGEGDMSVAEKTREAFSTHNAM